MALHATYRDVGEVTVVDLGGRIVLADVIDQLTFHHGVILSRLRYGRNRARCRFGRNRIGLATGKT